MTIFDYTINPYLASEINVIDCEGFGWENFSLSFFKKFSPLATVMFPRRGFRNYFLNANWIFAKGFEALKYLMPEDVRDSTFMYSDSSYKMDLMKYIDAEYIPKNYGGSGPMV